MQVYPGKETGLVAFVNVGSSKLCEHTSKAEANAGKIKMACKVGLSIPHDLKKVPPPFNLRWNAWDWFEETPSVERRRNRYIASFGHRDSRLPTSTCTLMVTIHHGYG